jgi:hypothetical protein
LVSVVVPVFIFIYLASIVIIVIRDCIIPPSYGLGEEMLSDIILDFTGFDLDIE